MDAATIKKLAQEAINNPVGIDWLDKMVERDNTRSYYVFLHNLAKTMKPKVIVELGVQTGRSTAHLASGAPQAKVVGIDIEFWEMDEILDNCPNIELIESQSQAVNIDELPKPIDILFIDSDHSYEQVMTEWKMYSPFVRKGGVILIDDIHYEMWPGVEQAWQEIKGKKVDISELHMSGFGAIIK